MQSPDFFQVKLPIAPPIKIKMIISAANASKTTTKSAPVPGTCRNIIMSPHIV
jgi:hypothetical protein